MAQLHGKTLGLKASQVRALKRLAHRRVRPEAVISAELAREMSEISNEIDRRVAVLVDRGGHVRHVCVGDAHRVDLPDIGGERSGAGRLRGLRLLHTQLRYRRERRWRPRDMDGADLAILARLRLDLSLEIEVDAEGLPRGFTRAHLFPPNPEGKRHEIERLAAIHPLLQGFQEAIEALEDEFAEKAPRARETDPGERAILCVLARHDLDRARRGLEELENLATSSGAVVVDRLLQRRDRPDPAFLIGRGKMADLSLRILRTDADLVIFGQELSPVQARNIADALGAKVIDRTQLILDIFAQRARSADGKLQVELARLAYQLPRLRRPDDAMEQIRGGIGSGRGVGEAKLELDRRRLRRRIHDLREEIAKLARRRDLVRKRRRKNEVPVAALIGYTNAGKSTIFNRLSRAGVPADDRLFVTLDTTARRIERDGAALILTDTVGFIQDLPPYLMDAFQATLEELLDADLLIHVADASDPAVFDHLEDVEKVLRRIGAAEIPRVLLFNKADAADVDAFRPLVASLDCAIDSAREEGFEDRMWGRIRAALG
ncbi:MAG: GTPase HflX [Planctomycetes bacterium]|nr:GTPase HflX [Planctomycetota bacterium]